MRRGALERVPAHVALAQRLIRGRASTQPEQSLREQARLKSGLASLSDVAQARVTYTQFKANLIAADALVLTRENTLRNIIGLPPNDNRRWAIADNAIYHDPEHASEILLPVIPASAAGGGAR